MRAEFKGKVWTGAYAPQKIAAVCQKIAAVRARENLSG